MTPARPDFDRTPLRPDRVRTIDGSFAFLPHRFLRHGFWASLDHRETLLYVLLALVADRQGMSFYFDDRLAAILRVVLDDFLAARAGLIRKDLVAYDPAGPRYQLLALPQCPVVATQAPTAPRPNSRAAIEPTPIRHLIRDWLAAHANDDRDR